VILDIRYSVKHVPIRLTEERWEHILLNHQEFSYHDKELILDAIEAPEYVLSGRAGSLVAVVALGKGAYLHVYYKEKRDGSDGFIITARIRPKVNKRLIIWP